MAKTWRPSSPWSTLSLSAKSWHTRRRRRSAAEIDWTRAQETPGPPQSWFDDKEDNPFEPEEEPRAVTPSRRLQLGNVLWAELEGSNGYHAKTPVMCTECMKCS